MDYHGGVGVLLPIISLTPSEEDMFPFKLKGLSRKTTKGISEGFDDLINSELSISSTLSSHEKLRNLKPKIRLWHNLLWNNDISRKQDAIKFLKILEDKIDAGNASTEDRDTRINIIQEIEKFDNLEAMDSIQKAHIKWDVEGDENSKYFHSLIKQKRRSNSINGIMHEGLWVTDPQQIKESFLNFFKQKFQANDSSIDFPSLIPSAKLIDNDRVFLETYASMDEVKAAVWGCGSDKAPGPDGYTFAFIKKYWDFLNLDILRFVNSFLSSMKMPLGANSSFITLIPKVPNPIHITDFRPISLIGIHYKIVAKVLANRLSKVVDKIVSQEQTAFIANRQILDGHLILSEAIDCPTFEFNIKRGLRQGDPLSPFLFIIIMEGLHLSILDSVRNGLFCGINIGSSGVSHEEVQLMASNTGCKAGKFPFSYLGLPIGQLTLLKVVLGSLGIYFLSLFKAPSTVLKTLENIRASFFWGGSLTSKKMSWLKWPHVLSSFDKGGLAIGSLKAFNLALLQKWRWRIVGTSNYLHSSSIIPIDSIRFQVGCGSTIKFWKDTWLGNSPLCTRFNRLCRLERDKDCLIRDRIYNDHWNWNWSRNTLGVRNSSYLDQLIADISHLEVREGPDKCLWSTSHDGTFSVGALRRIIDDHLLPSMATKTTWEKTLPRKVNIFLWRLNLDRFPHRFNLSSRGIDIPEISCPSCNGNVESNTLIFFECPLAKEV
ncbi:RNA-directed DNA polymerase, eukaryota, reverse transcriptase zinc-binding domain protein [Tanacetum coccineum]